MLHQNPRTFGKPRSLWTLELIAETGEAQSDLTPLFAELKADPLDALDAVLDRDNMPLAGEPAAVVAELDAIRGRF